MDWFLFDGDLRHGRVKPDALYLPLQAFFQRKVKQKKWLHIFSFSETASNVLVSSRMLLLINSCHPF